MAIVITFISTSLIDVNFNVHVDIVTNVNIWGKCSGDKCFAHLKSLWLNP
ncbi:MAG: hypothetical protein K6E29_01640 [Cyanobacteria bacterium RUI128]|nr:hypothetical protein [Cyanobacteria bacterium RUI128]